MPISHRVDPERRLVVCTMHGVLADDDLARSPSSLLSDPAFDPAFDLVVDARGVTALEITSSAVRRAAQTDAFSERARRAIIVADDAAYGLARMFHSILMAEPHSVLITRDHDEALRWLGLA